MRVDLNLIVVGLLLFLAAIVQDGCAFGTEQSVKFYVITAVALYVMQTKNLPVVILGLIWAGALTDALGGVSQGCTLAFLMLVFLAVRGLQRIFLAPSLWHGVILCACVSVLQVVWTRLFVGWTGYSFFSWTQFVRIAEAFPAGAVAGCIGFMACIWLDQRLGLRVDAAKIDAPWLVQ